VADACSGFEMLRAARDFLARISMRPQLTGADGM
jgi:hypothetical protein